MARSLSPDSPETDEPHGGAGKPSAEKIPHSIAPHYIRSRSSLRKTECVCPVPGEDDYVRSAQIALTSLAVNRFPLALKTSSASSMLSRVKSVAICCSRENDSRNEPDAYGACEMRCERMLRMSRSRRRAPS